MKRKSILLWLFALSLVLASCQKPIDSIASRSAAVTVSSPCPNAVNSPNGSVPPRVKACSPDGTKYVREKEPFNQGQFGIFNAQTDALLTTVSMNEKNNDLKGLAWSPNSQVLAITYHHGSGGYISIMDVVTTKEIDRIQIDRWYHQMEFSKDGRSIVAEGKVFPIKAFSNGSKSSVNGITYVSWQRGEYSTPTSDKSLRLLAATGAIWVAILVTGHQETITSTAINRFSPETPSDEDLAHAIATARSLGLHVMLKPHVDLDDPAYWRGQIGTRFTSEQQWQAWFASYREFITHYSSLAEANGVEQFVVGTELVGTTNREQEWRSIIAEVRSQFKGAITYASNHSGEEKQIRFWGRTSDL